MDASVVQAWSATLKYFAQKSPRDMIWWSSNHNASNEKSFANMLKQLNWSGVATWSLIPAEKDLLARRGGAAQAGQIDQTFDVVDKIFMASPTSLTLDAQPRKFLPSGYCFW